MDLGVPVDVVDEPLHVLDVLDVLVHVHDVVVGLHHLAEEVEVVDFLGLDAGLPLLVAHDLDAGVLVAAEEGEALGQHGDGVALDEVPPGLAVGQGVEVPGPSLVAHSGGAEGDHLDGVEHVAVLEVDEGEPGQGSSQRDARDVEFVEPGLLLDLEQVPGHVVPDLVPHLVVGALHLALLAGVLVGALEGVEQVLPEVEGVGGVSEGQHHELGVHAQDALDLGLGVVDVVSVKGFVGVVAGGADPEFEVLGSAHDQRVGEDHLVPPGQGVEGDEESAQGQQNLASHGRN